MIQESSDCTQNCLKFERVDVVLALHRWSLTAYAEVAQLRPHCRREALMYGVTSVSGLLSDKPWQTAGDAHQASWYMT